MLRSILVITLLGAVPTFAAAQVQHQSTHGPLYDVVAIKNGTNQTVTYTYSWGEGEEKSMTLAPGATYRHWWKFHDGPEGPSPEFQITFLWTMRQGNTEARGAERYILDKNRSHSTAVQYAKRYHFGWRDGRHELYRSR